MRILKLHPLAFTPMKKVFPSLACIMCCKRKVNVELAQVLRKELREQNEQMVSVYIRPSTFVTGSVYFDVFRTGCLLSTMSLTRAQAC